MGFQECFKALSDPLRRDILLFLRDGEKKVGEIVKQFDLSDAAMSYHLNQLKKADLIRTRKYKNYIFYELNISVVEEVLLWFERFKEKKNDEK